ncbi:hypothetical protein C0992_006178 [Termitomyces sp. T32_za158]|nr:hypothetical protein C0992_006178 [Termitomyces sp. T32_za158]
MARRIYAVRDCFQAIVINTRRHVSEEDTCRVQSLATLCSIVAGDSMEDQVINDNNGEGEEGEDYSKLLNDLYDVIPAVYRSNNATLLTKLLNVALDHKLNPEASLLLHGIVSLSLSSPSDTPNIPFICRPAHKNFFLDLYTQWNSSGSSNATFFRILFSALEASQNARIWSTPALHSIAQLMYVQDFASYLRLISISSTFIAEPCTTSVVSQLEARESLLSRIYTWLKTILEQLPPTTIERGSDKSMEAYSDDVGEMLTYVLSLICSPKASQVLDGPEAELQGIILSLSAQWLTVSVDSIPLQILVEKLSVTLPRVSTFTPLVTKVFLDSKGCIRVLRTAIQDIASTLYSYNLLHLRASLLGCTLRYIENPSHERELATKNGVPKLQNYRHELIKLADEAEDKFVKPHESLVSGSFPQRSHAIATPLRRELFRDISEWEPRSESWIRKLEYGTPAQKRKEYGSRRPTLRPDHGQSFRITPGRKFLFSTLLSRAASRRAILHPIQPLAYIPSVSEEFGKADQENDDTSDDDCQPVFFSDDALDLFASASNSTQ